MLLRLCQLKSLLFLSLAVTVLSSCSWRKNEYVSSSDLLNTFENNWFSKNENHALITSEGVPASHLFFDTQPSYNKNERTVNAVITVPVGSQHAYEIDPRSGQRYYTHTYCQQNDVWNIYSGPIGRPPFSIGHIPKALDQTGDSQRVIIFSKQSGYPRYVSTNYHRVKLIGAFVEQVCPEGNCLGRSNWLSRLVFVAVDADDPELKRLTTTEEFKKVFDWDVAKAHLENMNGRNFIGSQTYPSIRVSKLIEYEDAFDFFSKRAIFLTDKELKKIQSGCHGLYDKLWEDVGKVRPEDRGAKDDKELNGKVKLHNELRKQKKPVGFAERMKVFTQKYFKEVTTCDKFVYYGNLNKDPEKFWFLNYMNLFYRLHRDGYYFDCKSKTWLKNTYNHRGELTYQLNRDFRECSEKDIDRAMIYLPNFLNTLKTEKDYYRFIDYDNHSFGSHEKLYSWIKMKSRRFECSGDSNARINKELRIFPEDIKWKERHTEDFAGREKIIY